MADLFAYLDGFGTGGSLTKSVIIVTDLPTGSTVTATPTKGGAVKTATEKNGEWWFRNLDIGEWILKATLGDQSAITTYNIEQFGVYRVPMSYIKIYGIMRDITNSSPAWERTDDAVGLTATASVGTVPGHSDFDTCYPWSEINRETLSTGDVMVKIPKFWFRRWRDENVEHIQIADRAIAEFELHPAFYHSGVEQDCIYVGAYKTSSNNKSVSGASPTVEQTIGAMRINAKSKGDGWSLIDISSVSAIQMLVLVEFATNDVQTAIGRGYCDKSSSGARINTGSTNNVPNLTGRPAGTDGLVDVVWRGVEGFWGNIWEWTDGVNWNSGTYYVCNDPSKYASNTADNYTALSFKGATNWSSSYITEEGLDTGNNEHVMLPKVAGSGSDSTYYCDSCWSASGWTIFQRGGSWEFNSACGLFLARLSNQSSANSAAVGSRLMYIPQEVA